MSINLVTQDQASGGIGPVDSVLFRKLNEIITDFNTLLATGPWDYVGEIATAAGFPTLAVVEEGFVYKVTADVTDNDATKTNTGKSFLAGTKIVWSPSATWEDLGIVESVSLQATTPLTIGAGNVVAFIDTATIAGAVAVALPAVSAGLIGKTIVLGDYTLRAGSFNITITPDGTDEIDGVNAPVVLAKNGELIALQCLGAAGWKTIYRTIPVDNSFNIAAVAPTVDADALNGYFVGSRWYDTVTGIWRVCTDATTGAAVWSNQALCTVAAVAPTVNEDTLNGYFIGSRWFDSVTGIFYICTDATTGAAVWSNLAAAVSGGASGLMTGSDKAILDAIADDHIRSYHADVTLQVDESEVSAALPGLVSEAFIPEEIVVVFKSASGAVAEDATLNIGTTSDGAEILAAAAMTGITAAGDARRIPLTAAATWSILANDTLYANVESEDTTATTLVVDVYVLGRKF